MIETVVSLETAKLLKEREFNVNVNAYYDDCNKLQVDKPKNDWNDPLYLGTICSAPTQSLAQQWLRTLGVHIEILLEEDSPYESYYYRVMKVGQYFSLSYNPFKGTYEEALEEGLKQALKLI